MATLQMFESALLSAVNTAQSQPAQIPTVCEGVYASVLLLRLLRSDMLSGRYSYVRDKLILLQINYSTY